MNTTGGKVLVNKNNVSKFVPKDLLNQYLKEGWQKGNTQKNKEIFKRALHNKLKTDQQYRENLGRAKTKEKELERKKKISLAMKGNTNWIFNKRKGNGKKGWYKNIFCDSAWELAFVVYYIENKLNIQRCTEYRQYKWRGEYHKYLPDFVTDEGIIEVKGTKDDKYRAKIKQHPDIIVYDAWKMKPILDYVIAKYGDEFWKTLYEKH